MAVEVAVEAEEEEELSVSISEKEEEEKLPMAGGKKIEGWAELNVLPL